MAQAENSENLKSDVSTEMEDAFSMSSLKESIEELYIFRDSFFDQNPQAEVESRKDEVEKRLKGILKKLEDNREHLEKEQRGIYFTLKGKALNIRSEYEKETEDTLTRALKMDPKLIEAWNELGECYWKKGDIENAQKCFEKALKQSKNKVSLRNYSMCLRQIGSTPEEKGKNICESVEKAREAVQLDLQDGESWYVLGNAYLSLFFMGTQNAKVLNQALTAYGRAVEDIKMKCSVELHYNRAVGFRHQEEYQKALEDFDRASNLDPSWNDPKEKSQFLLKYLLKVKEMIDTKGNTKPRKLQMLLNGLKPHHAGPYKERPLKHVKLTELKPEVNAGCFVMGKVVCHVPNDECIPFTFCLVDEDKTIFPVTLYNLAQGKGVIIGDSVAIPEPKVNFVHVRYHDKEIQFSSIRVDLPLTLVVNGRLLDISNQAPIQISVDQKPE